jgi:predicted DNA-binding transcriptional regulator AlpA
MTKAELATSTAVSPPAGSIAHVEDDGLYDLDFVCKFFGGSKPLHAATIYRGIAQGRYPRPVRPSPNVNRWVGRELKTARQMIFDAPRAPLRSPTHKRQSA